MEKQKEQLTEDQIKLVAEAFAAEAVFKHMAAHAKESMLDIDQLHQLFSHNRQEFTKVRQAILSELMAIQERMKNDAGKAFDQISVKFSQFRLEEI